MAAARGYLPREMQEARGYEEFLEYNELELALDELEALALDRPMTAAFWAEMLEAAQIMALPDHQSRYEQASWNGEPAPEWTSRLEAELRDNPLYLEMRSLAWARTAPLMSWPPQNSHAGAKYFSAGDQEAIASVVADRGCPLVMLSYFTSHTVPEPLSGHGDLYAFFFDPVSFKLVLGAVAKNGWRS